MYIENSMLNMLLAIFSGFFLLMGLSMSLRKLPIAYRILGILFILVGFNLFIVHINFSGLLRMYPHLYRIGAPTFYILGPLYFLFVRYLIDPYAKWKWWYALFFIPTVAHLVEMLPIYLLSASEKKALVEEYYSESMETMKAGVLHYRTHTVLRAGMIFMFSAMAMYILKPVILNRKHLLYGRNRLLLIWVITATILNMIAFFSICISYAFYKLFPAAFIKSSYFIFFIDNTFNALFLLFNPQFLEGVQWSTVPIIESEEEDGLYSSAASDLKKEGTSEQTPVAKPELLHQLDYYLQFEQPYLNDKLTIEMVANHLDVKAYKLSKAIKSYYGISFADLINSYRLNYIDEKMRTDAIWKSYSIESMAYQAGFGSRAAFYVAFRKLKKEQPKAYYGLN